MFMESIRVDTGNEDAGMANLNIGIGGLPDDHSNTPLTHDGVGYTTRGFGPHPKTGIVVFLDVSDMKGIWTRKPINVVNSWNSVIVSFSRCF